MKRKWENKGTEREGKRLRKAVERKNEKKKKI